MPIALKEKQKQNKVVRAQTPKPAPYGKLYAMPTYRQTERTQAIFTQRNLLICLLLVAATLALYTPAMRHPFVNYDDDVYVTRNEHVQSGLSLQTIEWAFATTDAANWHPLTWLSHALDWQLFAAHASGHHATSVLIHAVNVVLLFLLLLWATGQEKASLLVAALFAVHPINAESVAWIAERKNVLCTFFFFTALAAYGRYALRPTWRRYLAVAGLFAVGLMAKPMVITFPFVLLLVDFWPLYRVKGTAPGFLHAPQRSISKLVLEKLPLLLISAASALITLQVQSSGGAVRSAIKLAFGVRLENALVAYPTYPLKMLWPSGLAILYPHPGDTLKAWQLILSGAVLLGTAALAYFFRAKRYPLVGWLWFLGTLVPVIGIVQVGDMARADRYAYIPLIGIFAMIVFGLADLADTFHLKTPVRIIPAAAVLLALAFVTHHQLGYWSSSENLWRRALAVTQDNLIAHRNLASALVEAGKPDEAYEEFKAEVVLNPHDMLAQLEIGAYLYSKGKLPEALAQFDKMIHLTKERDPLSAAYVGLGKVYTDMGKDGAAYLNFERAVRLNPDQANAYYGLGKLAEKNNQPEEAIYSYSRLVELAPSGVSYQLLGNVLKSANRPIEALNAYQDAVQLSPELKDPLAPAIASLTSSTQDH